jgi:branched-chain amino acid transport system substrate-binding protein
MKTTLARHTAALIACAALTFASPALAQDKTVKIGVLNDMSSLYADIGGPNSVVAVKMAVEDSGLTKKGWKIDVVSGDHQNKPDVGVNIARQWIDSDKVDAIADTPNSGVALAVSNLEGKERGAAQFRRRHCRSHRQGLHAEHDLLHL